MSAITVIYNLDERPVESRVMDKALDCLKHRGADDRGVWIDGNLGLGHAMRWTTPESLHEKLPLSNHGSQTVITSDARIDNRDDLLSQLSFLGRPASEITDSDIILAAYEKWGEECPAKLIGDFVFAIWDGRKQSLFCARDPLGLKHFYYYYAPGKIFALASEIKALLEIDGIETALDHDHLADYLVLTLEDKEATFYKNIRRLPATHSLCVNRDRISTTRYWQPSFKEIKLKGDGEYHEAFRERFSEAVKSRLRSAYPVGAMLSGGLDSSAVTCVASQLLKSGGGKELHTFSAVFPSVSKEDPRIDETRYMQSVIDRIGCIPHFVNVDDASPLQNMDKIVWHTDHPVGPLNVYMDSEIFKHAAQTGVRVLLTGHDGDATVTYGYQELAELAKRGRFLRLIRDAKALTRNMPDKAHTMKKLVWHRGIKAAIPSTLLDLWRKVRNRSEEDYTVSPVQHTLHLHAVRPEFRSQDHLKNRIRDLHKANYESNSNPALFHWKCLTGGIFTAMHEQIEKLSAAYSIEPRHPFFDRRLIEFCVALPPGQRIYKGWTRSIFRFAMEGILPPEVQWRVDKANLGAHIKLNLLKYGSGDIESAFAHDLSKLDRYIDTGLLKAAYQDYKQDANRRDAEALFVLTNMYLLKWFSLAGSRLLSNA